MLVKTNKSVDKFNISHRIFDLRDKFKTPAEQEI